MYDAMPLKRIMYDNILCMKRL